MQGAHSQTGPGLRAEPRQDTARPGNWQWLAVDTAALGQAVDGSVYTHTAGG